MNERSQRIEARLEIPMSIAALLVIPLLLLEQSASTDAARNVAEVLNWGIWLAFLFEGVVMLVVVSDRWMWIRRHPLEVLVVLITAPVLPASLQALRAIRLLRLFRVLLFAKRLRHLLTPGGLSQAALFGLVTVVAGGAALRLVEPGLELSAADGVWWALTTATTVGYGDIFPVTGAGRAIAGIVMLVGVGFVALLTAALARVFLAEDETSIDQDLLLTLQSIEGRLARMEDRLASEDAVR